MGDVCCRRRVRRRADARFIGIQAALDALHEGGRAEACRAAEDRLEIERARENAAQHLGQHAGVDHHDDERHDDVQHAHDRHEHARDLDDAVAVAEDADAYEEREQRAADDRQEMRARGSNERIIEVIARHAVDEVEGGEHVEADRIGRDQRDRENNAEAPASESRLDIVGRAAVAAALGAALFIDLRERALDKGGRAANQSDEPHPEHRAVAADGDSVGDADDIARADAARRRDHQRFKRADRLGVARFFADHAHRLPEQTYLNARRADGEVNARREQQDDEHIAVHQIVERADQTGKAVVKSI